MLFSNRNASLPIPSSSSDSVHCAVFFTSGAATTGHGRLRRRLPSTIPRMAAVRPVRVASSPEGSTAPVRILSRSLFAMTQVTIPSGKLTITPTPTQTDSPPATRPMLPSRVRSRPRWGSESRQSRPGRRSKRAEPCSGSNSMPHEGQAMASQATGVLQPGQCGRGRSWPGRLRGGRRSGGASDRSRTGGRGSDWARNEAWQPWQRTCFPSMASAICTL